MYRLFQSRLLPYSASAFIYGETAGIFGMRLEILGRRIFHEISAMEIYSRDTHIRYCGTIYLVWDTVKSFVVFYNNGSGQNTKNGFHIVST